MFFEHFLKMQNGEFWVQWEAMLPHVEISYLNL